MFLSPDTQADVVHNHFIINEVVFVIFGLGFLILNVAEKTVIIMKIQVWLYTNIQSVYKRVASFVILTRNVQMIQFREPKKWTIIKRTQDTQNHTFLTHTFRI